MAIRIRVLVNLLPFKTILLVSALLIGLGSMLGNLNASAGGWVCDTGAENCTIEGCRNSLANGQGTWVCMYSGSSCPPLNTCAWDPEID